MRHPIFKTEEERARFLERVQEGRKRYEEAREQALLAIEIDELRAENARLRALLERPRWRWRLFWH